jgi:hypothetical protein
MIVSAARLHGRASSRYGAYMRGGGVDNEQRANGFAIAPGIVLKAARG